MKWQIGKRVGLVMALALLCPWAGKAQPSDAPKYEMRAGWIASVGNLDWPSKKGLPVAQQKAEYIAFLDTLVAMNANAVVMHIRPTADAFYPSDLEPWSQYLTGKQGQAPDPLYDPVAFMIAEAHKRGLEFHAWLNPYRVSQTADTAQFAPTHAFHQHRDWFVEYGGKWYFDPGIPQCREFANAMLLDLVKRYDVDAIHFDDYFYPYRVAAKDEQGKGYIVEFPDSLSWERYGKPFFKDRDAWRRQNVNLLIEEFSRTIRQTKPWVKFGISPFCVWRNASKDPRGSETFVQQTNYDDLFADILLWMDRGWIDYVTPQMYYPTTNKNANYDKVLSWWSNLTQPDKFHLYCGLSMWNETPELQYEIARQREMPDKVQGTFFWSTRVFMQNKKGLNQVLQADEYRYPALVPPMPWHDMTPPAAPKDLSADGKAHLVMLSWETVYSDNLMYYLVYRFAKGQAVDLNDPSAIVAKVLYDHDARKVYLDQEAAAGEYTYVVTALSRNNVESTPVKTTVKVSKTKVTTINKKE